MSPQLPGPGEQQFVAVLGRPRDSVIVVPSAIVNSARPDRMINLADLFIAITSNHESEREGNSRIVDNRIRNVTGPGALRIITAACSLPLIPTRVHSREMT